MGRSGKGNKLQSRGGQARASFRGKASPELVEEVRSLISQIDSQELREKYRQGNINNNFEGQDMDKRYRYDLFWAAAGDIYSKVNKEGLKSDHLDTLLKEVVPPLSEDVELESGPTSLNGNDPVGEIRIRPNVSPFNPDPNLQYDEKGPYTIIGRQAAQNNSLSDGEASVAEELSEEEDRLETVRAKEKQKLRAGLEDRKYARQAKQEKSKKAKAATEDSLVAGVDSDLEDIESQDKLLKEFDL
jgi:hypothetical protein